jgi:pimeloyl-ACP methyl ester carboxylesterase
MGIRNVVLVHGAFADGSSWSKAAAWRTKPSHYIVASKDRMIAPEQEQSMATKIGAKTTTVPSSHAVMLSHATEVARVIDEAARAVAS